MKFATASILKLIIVLIVIIIVATAVTNFTAPMTEDVLDTISVFIPDISYFEVPCAYFCLSDLSDEEVAVMNYGISDTSCIDDEECCTAYCKSNCPPPECEKYLISGSCTCGACACDEPDDLCKECCNCCEDYNNGLFDLPDECEACSSSELGLCLFKCNKVKGFCEKKEGLDFSVIERLPLYFSCNYQLLDFVQMALEYGKYKYDYITETIRTAISDNLVFKLNQEVINYLDENNLDCSDVDGVNDGCEANHTEVIDDIISKIIEGEVFNHPFVVSQSSELSYYNYLGWVVMDYELIEEVYLYDLIEESYKTLIARAPKFGDTYSVPQLCFNCPDIVYEETTAVSFLNYYDDAVEFLHNCFKGDCNDEVEIQSLGLIGGYNMHSFCLNNPGLKSYGYINCLDLRSLKERFDPVNYTLMPRTGMDLVNLTCYNGPYDACNYEFEKYGAVSGGGDADPDCQPAWETMIQKRGTCADLAIMEYAVFRTLGIPDSSLGIVPPPITVSLELGACGLPCPCMELVEQCSYYSEEISCITNNEVTVEPLGAYGSYNPCDYLESAPEFYGGTYIIDIQGSVFNINQYHRSVEPYCRYRLVKSFNNLDDDYLLTECKTQFDVNEVTHESYAGVACGNELSDASLSDLVNACAEFLDNPDDKDAFKAVAVCGE